MFCNVWYVKVNMVNEVPMVVQHTLSYSGYVKSELYSTCRCSHALNCQATPQNKVNIGAYVSRCEVQRLLRSFELVVHKPVHLIPMRHLNEFQVARAVTLIQEGWTFRRVAVDINVLRQLFAACGIATTRQTSSQGVLDKVVDARQSHKMTDI